jgi:hypothetical protein
MTTQNKVILIASIVFFVGGLTYYIVDKRKVGKGDKK